VTTKADEAAIAAARTEAQAAIDGLGNAEQTAQDYRNKRDAAIHKMNEAGRSVPDISRDLGLPTSTVRQSIKSAIVRSARG
jgi:hypothetical protein